MDKYLMPLLGGGLIGLSVSLMLLLNGRVTGISGIVYGAAVKPAPHERAWRWSFVAGLFLGGLILRFVYDEAFGGILTTPTWTIIAAGLLVGFGTVLGNGCTSGHGVCGISRFSLRSALATITFISAGVLAVFLFRYLGVLP